MAISFTVGTAVNATVTITNAIGATVTNLPAGVTASGAASGTDWVITFTGTPTTASTGHIDIVATNTCGATPATANNTGDTGFDWTVGAAALSPCTAPTINATINPTTGTSGTSGTWTITLSNATSATWPSKPAWMSESYNAATGTLTLTGTPTAAATFTNIQISATNGAAGCISTSVTGLNGGTLTIAGAALPSQVFGQEDCCGEPPGSGSAPMVFTPYTIGTTPALPGLSAACTLSFSLNACNDPRVAFTAFSVYGFGDVVSCQAQSPGFLPGWLYLDATQSIVVCPSAAQNSFGSPCSSTGC